MPYIPPESKSSKPKRRSFTVAQKKAIVEEALAPGASVSRVARAHDLNTNQVFKWMREYQGKRHSESIASTLIPVMLSHTDVAVMPAMAETPIMATGTMELHLPKGRVCLTGAVDPGALRMVLEHLSA